MLYFAAVLTAMSVYTLKRMRAAAPIPSDVKGDFVAMGNGSQAVLHMDPRAVSTTETPVPKD